MSSGLSGKVIGAVGMTARLSNAQQGAERGAVKGLRLAAHLVLQVSNKRVPHEEGDLERDGAVVVDPDIKVAGISYGNNEDTAAYAEVQHERLDYQHDDGRSAKFLESAVNETADQVSQIIAEQTRRGMTEGAAK